MSPRIILRLSRFKCLFYSELKKLSSILCPVPACGCAIPNTESPQRETTRCVYLLGIQLLGTVFPIRAQNCPSPYFTTMVRDIDSQEIFADL
jgi:hypothetical protein